MHASRRFRGLNTEGPKPSNAAEGENSLKIGRVLVEQVGVDFLVLDPEDLDRSDPPAGLAAVSRALHAAFLVLKLAQPLVLLVVPAETLLSELDALPRVNEHKYEAGK